MKTLAERLRWARERMIPPMSQSELARRVGLKPQSIQALESGRAKESGKVSAIAREVDVDGDWLADGVGKPERKQPPTKARGFAEEVPEFSTSPQHTIEKREISHTTARLSDDYVNLGRRTPAPEFIGGARDLEVRGTAMCGDGERGDFRFNGEVVDYVRRPPRLTDVKKAFVVYTVGSSMEPRFFPGDPAYIHPGQPVRPGDVVLVEFHPERDGESGAAMIKVLVAKTATKYRFKQYNPPNDRIEIEERKVKHVYRVIPYPELLGL